MSRFGSDKPDTRFDLELVSVSDIFLNKTPPLCFMKPVLRLICSNSLDIIFYNIKMNIKKTIKIIIKKYITDICNEVFVSHLNIFSTF